MAIGANHFSYENTGSIYINERNASITPRCAAHYFPTGVNGYGIAKEFGQSCNAGAMVDSGRIGQLRRSSERTNGCGQGIN